MPKSSQVPTCGINCWSDPKPPTNDVRVLPTTVNVIGGYNDDDDDDDDDEATLTSESGTDGDLDKSFFEEDEEE